MIRRRIVAMTEGDSATFDLSGAGVDIAAVRAETERFARARRILLDIETSGTTLRLTHRGMRERRRAYPELDALALGESVTYPLPPSLHYLVRSAASARMRSTGVRLVCRAGADGITVTRVPASVEEAQSAPTAQPPPARRSKYGLDRLEHETSVYFDLPAAEHHKVRLAATHKARMKGWTLSCRQEGTGIRVIRTEAP